MSADLCGAVARRVRMSAEQVRSALALLDAGQGPVFIAHHRKAATGGLDEPCLRRIAAAAGRERRLADLRAEVRRLAKDAGALVPDLKDAIGRADEEDVLEDLAAPLRPGRRTAASVALERGLGPLADYLLQGPADGPAPEAKAAEFVDPAREVFAPADALAGAGHVLAERFWSDWRLRQAVRDAVLERGILRCEQAKGGGKGAGEFRGYFNFQEPLKRLPPHRVLAINRGERSKALKVVIEVGRDELLADLLGRVAPPDHRFRDRLGAILADALGRLILPAAERLVRRRLTQAAEDHAIEVFAENLRGLLMAPPQQGLTLLALQPGFRSGCKVAVLDPEGRLLSETIIYPFEPQRKRDEAKTALLLDIRRHGVRAVAIGNGTGCRDCEELLSELLDENDLDLRYTIVNEAGASIWADSQEARQEFPNFEAAVRAAVSIGRRLQDPLRELVRIDPRAIGVGLYQHDVAQDRLKEELEATVQSCVCAVGAEAGAASAAMLRYVPGLGPDQVQALLARRAQAPLASRDELRGLAGWDETAFLQAAGFLRVRGPNPLDDTRVHPESYDRAAAILAKVGLSADHLKDADGRRAVRKALTGLALEPLVEELALPLLDLADLVAALQRPDHDPRRGQHGPIFRQRIQRIEDFRPGQWVKGTVRNVVDFGAFVDIGLKEDGLIHISQFSKRYVRSPMKYLHVGDVVDARIVSIDGARQRIALTLIREEKAAPAASGAAAAPAEAAGAAPAEAVGSGAAVERAPRGPAPERRSDRPPPRGRGRQGRPPRGGPRPEGEPAGRPRRQGARPTGDGTRPPRQGGRPSAEADRRGPPRKRDRHRPRPDRPAAPRVHTFRDEPQETGPAELDEKGRPKIRWAWYDSDHRPDEDEDALAEEELPEEQDAEEEPVAEEQEPLAEEESPEEQDAEEEPVAEEQEPLAEEESLEEQAPPEPV